MNRPLFEDEEEDDDEIWVLPKGKQPKPTVCAYCGNEKDTALCPGCGASVSVKPK